ncbi:MAG: hypothetical protein Q9157_002648 [Trypethelium eluteriae]
MNLEQSHGEMESRIVDFETSNWQKAKAMFVEARRDKDEEVKLGQFLQGWVSVQDAKDMCIATKNQASKEYAPMLGSILNKIDMASKVGDLAMKSAPESIGLAWMGVKLCLHSVMDDFATCQSFGVACSDIIGILISCACYGRMFGIPKGPKSFQEIHSQIVDQIPQIYCNILEVSFSVKKYMSHNKLVRTGKYFFKSANEKFKDKIQALHENEAKMSDFAHTASEQMQEYYSTKMLANQSRSFEAQDAIARDLQVLKEELSSYEHIRKSDEISNAELLEHLRGINTKTPLAAAKEQCQNYRKQLRMDAVQSNILQAKINERSPPETCTWIFRHRDYEEWRDAPSNNILWVSGRGGCGKSILVSAIIDTLRTEVEEGRNLLHYFYCDAGDESSKKTEKIHKHLLSQLLEMVEKTDAVGKIDEANKVTNKFLQKRTDTKQAKRISSKDSISFTEAYQDLARILGQPKIYLVIDALDECIDLEKEGLIQSLKDIINYEILGVRLKFLICSRPEPEIEKALNDYSSIDVEGNNSLDIESNVKVELSQLSGWTEEERDLACKEVTRKAGGYFRCVALLIQFLRKPWQRPLSHRLSELPEGLNNNYREILQKTDKAYIELLRICMTWITLAEDEIKVGEIIDIYSRTFCELEDGSKIPENDGPHQIDQIRSAGSSFVRVIPDTNIIKLRHYTVKEFFLGSRKSQTIGISGTNTLSSEPAHSEADQPFEISEKHGHIEIAITILDHISSKLFRETYMKSYLPIIGNESDVPSAPDGTVNSSMMDETDSHAVDIVALPNEDQAVSQETDDSKMTSTTSDGSVSSHSDETERENSQARLNGVSDENLDSEQPNTNGENVEVSTDNQVQDADARDGLDSDSDVDSDDLENKPVFDSFGENVRIFRYEPHYLGYHLQKIEELWGSSAHEDALWKKFSERLMDFMRPDSEAFLTWVNYLAERGQMIVKSERGTITPIHVACGYGLLSVLKRLIDRGDDTHKFTTAGWNALHFAADAPSCTQKTEMLKILLRAGHDPNSMKDCLFSPFHLLLLCGATAEEVRLFIENGADCDLRSSDKRTALQIASRSSDDLDVLKTVLEGVHDINVGDQSGQTALHLLMYRGKVPPEFLSAFLERGANVNAEDEHSKMPLAIAASWGQAETVERLVEAGAMIDDDDVGGMTALHFAALNGQSSNIQSLLKKEADAERTDFKGNTALFHAFAHGDLLTCETLVNWYKANNPSILKRANKKGKTPLRKAAAAGYTGAIEVLLNTTSDVGINEADNRLGHTPLHAAARRGHSAIVQKLIDCEADTVIKDRQGKTALQVACLAWNEDDMEGDYEEVLLSLMLEDPETASQDPILLHVAASKGSLDILRRLHEFNVDFNRQDEHGWTALEFARQYDQKQTIYFLEEKGASVGKQPSKWEITKPQYLRVSDDGLQISYIHKDEKDRACALTDHPLPAGTRRYYFEVELLRLAGEKGFPEVAIGLSGKRNAVKLFRWLPGWRRGGPTSWGYHGDDGAIECSTEDSEWRKNESKRYRYGDTVGCGFDRDRRAIFFTRNGVRLMNAASTNVTGRLYPVVGISDSITLRTNFGASEFKWKPGNMRDFDVDIVTEEAPATDGKEEQQAAAGAERGNVDPN